MRNGKLKFFSLINSALTSKIKIYLSSRIVSKDLEIDLKDLHSRLAYFTAIEVPEITNEEKLDAISQSSARKGIDLDTKTKNLLSTILLEAYPIYCNS